MQRLTITIDDELVAALNHFIAERGYQNRSEAIRDIIRERRNEFVVNGDRKSLHFLDLT